MISDGTNVRFFAGFTLSLAFRYSLTFIVRLKKFQTTRPLFGVSSFLQLSFRDFGCGKAMSFDDLFRKDRPNMALRRTASRCSKKVEGWEMIVESKARRRLQQWLSFFSLGSTRIAAATPLRLKSR